MSQSYYKIRVQLVWEKKHGVKKSLIGQPQLGFNGWKQTEYPTLEVALLAAEKTARITQLQVGVSIFTPTGTHGKMESEWWIDRYIVRPDGGITREYDNGRDWNIVTYEV